MAAAVQAVQQGQSQARREHVHAAGCHALHHPCMKLLGHDGVGLLCTPGCWEHLWLGGHGPPSGPVVSQQALPVCSQLCSRD